MTKFADVTPAQFDPEPKGFAAIDPSKFDAEPEQISPTETFAMNATNVFGAGPAIVGALQYIRGNDYARIRDAYRARMESANEQNPRAAIAGKVTSVLPETVLGGAAGRVVAGGSKAIGLTSKVAPFVKANPLITSVLEGGLSGAGYGAAGGAGEALSKGEDVAEGAKKGAAGGALVGGAFGAVTGGIAKAASGAVERADRQLIPGVTDAIVGEERSAVVTALRSDKELQKIASKPAAEAIQGMEARGAKLASKADDLIAHIESKAGGIPIGKFAAAIDAEIASLAKTPMREAYAKALESVKDSALKAWVPNDISALLSSTAARESRTGLAENLLKRRDAIKVPLSDLESLARDIPKNLPGTPEIKSHAMDVLRSIRDAHLTDVAIRNPEVKTAADSLRALDRDFEVISTITDTLKSRPSSDHGGLEKLISIFTHHGPIGAGLALASGHPIPAAILAAPAVARRGTAMLASLQREAAAGNAKAIRLLKAADVAKTIGAAGSGAVGNAQSGTIQSLAEGQSP